MSAESGGTPRSCEKVDVGGRSGALDCQILPPAKTGKTNVTPEWLTIDRAIILAAALASAVSAIYAGRAFHLARETRFETRRAGLPKLVLAVSTASTANGWHLAQLTRLEPAANAKYRIVALAVTRPRRTLICPIAEVASKADVWSGIAPLAELSSRQQQVKSWQWSPINDTGQTSLLFFVGARKNPSSRLCLRVTIEERSARQSRSRITVISNPIDWSAVKSR